MGDWRRVEVALDAGRRVLEALPYPDDLDNHFVGEDSLAEARVTLGVVAARRGDLDAALSAGRAALAGGRRSLPSLAMQTHELAAVLSEKFPGEAAVAAYLDEVLFGTSA